MKCIKTQQSNLPFEQWKQPNRHFQEKMLKYATSCLIMLLKERGILMKKGLSLLSCIAMLLVTTAQASMGVTCILFINQPKVPQCLLEND